jgi:hypothetical protein
VRVRRKITLKLYNLHSHECCNENVKGKLEKFGRSKHVWSVRGEIATSEHWKSDRQDDGGNNKENDNISNQICLKYM